LPIYDRDDPPMATILIVDDEPAVRFALEEALTTGGHTVIACATAAEARGRAAEAGALRRLARAADVTRALGTELIGDAPAWRRTVDQARRIARRDVAV